MIFVPTRHLQPGMLIGRSLTTGTSQIPLIVAGQRLDTVTIDKLNDRNIDGIHIETRLCGDVKNENFITPAFKKEMTEDLSKIYNGYLKDTAFSPKVGRLVVNMADKLMKFVLAKDECLLNVVEIKDYDNYTFSHSIYVGVLAVLIGLQLGGNQKMLAELAMAGLMHDIGKLDVPVSIVNKPAALTESEFTEMKKHPEYAMERLSANPVIPILVLQGIENHHEKFNGTGYPKGIEGESISLYGRILALADVYDALTSVRSYRRAWRPHEAIEYMLGSANTHFDYRVLQAFLKVVAPYPVGTIVELSNGMMAVVVKISKENILRPVVQIINESGEGGERIDMSADFEYLSLTITGTISDNKPLPPKMFE